MSNQAPNPDSAGTTAPSPRGPAHSRNREAACLGVLLLAATIALYYPVHRFEFLNYDDKLYVTENIYVRSGLHWDTVQWAFTTFHASNWHPLTWLSHALDYQLFALEPAGHHDVNLALHAVNVLLLFWILQRATGYLGRSAMVAALFALHPINIQSVAWVAERKNILSMLFFLLALGAYQSYGRVPRFGRYLLVALFYVLGLMAKPQVITLPFVLLLWDYWPLQRMFPAEYGAKAPPHRSLAALLWEKLPLFVIAAGSAAITMRAQRMGGAMKGYPWTIRLENAIVSYVRYLQKAFWPDRFAVMYPHPGSALAFSQVLASLAFLIGITALVVAHRRRRYLFVGWFWFLVTMVPMIGLVQVGVQAMADRYAYLPLVGLFIAVCWGVAEWCSLRHISMRVEAAVSLAAVLLLAAITHRELQYWTDSETLWLHALQVTRGNYIAEDNLGQVLVTRGEIDRGVQHFRSAVEMEPLDPLGNLNLGRYAQSQGHLSEAIRYYEISLAANSDRRMRANALSNMGQAYRDLGDETRAQACLNAAELLERNPPQ